MSGPRLNTEYLPRAAEALASARSNLTAAKAAAREGAMEPAASDLVTAGEEVAKALLCYAAYEDIVTFDPKRSNERVYLFSEDVLFQKHLPKQVSLYTFILTFMAFDAYKLAPSLPEPDREAFKNDTDTWMQVHFPAQHKVLDLADRFEELRQSRYSGRSTAGVRGPTLSRIDFDAFVEVVDNLADYADFEQNHYVRPAGELEAAQARIPKRIRLIQPALNAFSREAARIKKLAKEPEPVAPASRETKP